MYEMVVKIEAARTIEKMKYLVIILFFLVISCSEKKEVKRDIVIDQTLDSVINYVSSGFNLETEMVLSHFEYYPDRLKSGSLRNAVMSGLIDADSLLVKQLINSLNDSVIIILDDYKVRNGHIKIFESKGEDDSSVEEKPNFLGSINLTNSVSNERKACYYFALNCGNKCSVGFLIILELEEKKWAVKRIIQVWKG